MSQLWESARLKATQLEEEIRKSDATRGQKADMLHTLSKLTMFAHDALDEVRWSTLKEAAELCDAHAEWAAEPGRMPPEYCAGSVGSALGLAREIRDLRSPQATEVKGETK